MPGNRGRDSPHREQSNIHAVALQLQFDYGEEAFCRVGTDTSSGAIHATMVPDSKMMDMPYVVAGAANWVRDLEYECLCLHRDKEGVLQLDKVTTTSVTGTESSEQWRRGEAVSTVRGLARTYLADLKDIIPFFDVTTHSPMLPWTIRHAAWVLTRYNVRRDTVDRNTEKRSCHW